jgi:Uncharacterized proteins, LmbE homologs
MNASSSSPSIAATLAPQEDSSVEPAALAPLVVVSPHYDDAVFSCGHLLAAVPRSTVVTVCTALPQDGNVLTDWDGRCGFSCASDAMRVRATENTEALTVLEAEGLDLNFLDAQYAATLSNAVDLLSDSLSATLTLLQPSTVCFPIGLFHEDHVMVSDVLMTICHHFPSIRWLAYEDIPYRKREAFLRQRMDQLTARGMAVTLTPIDLASTHKERAVLAYKSQFRGLGYSDASPIMQQTERYWRVHHNMELL